MNTTFRWVLSAGAIVMVLASAIWLGSGCPSDGAADPDTKAAGPVEARGLSGHDLLLEQKRRERKRLDDEDDATLRRMEGKEQAAAELVAQRSTLLETAARFRDLDNASALFKWAEFRARTPGQTDEERHCREAIAYVRAQLRSQPDRAEAAAGRLEAELRRHLDRGTLSLP